MALGPLFPILLATHIVLAVGLLLPSLLLPFTMRASRGGRTEPSGPDQPRRLTRGLLWLQRNGTLALGGGLAVSGAALVLAAGTQLLSQPWLLVALTLYAANLLLAFFVQRPAVGRLLGMRSELSDANRERWRAWARRQRYVSYLMAGAVGVIGFLMMSKPQL